MGFEQAKHSKISFLLSEVLLAIELSNFKILHRVARVARFFPSVGEKTR